MAPRERRVAAKGGGRNRSVRDDAADDTRSRPNVVVVVVVVVESTCDVFRIPAIDVVGTAAVVVDATTDIAVAVVTWQVESNPGFREEGGIQI